jgi:hypothetical protein
MPPPLISPCSPSPLTPANEKPTSVKSSDTARACLKGSYGRQNRQAIAARERRIATRLRAVEKAYRMAIERDVEVSSPQPAGTLRSSERAPDREIEME